ncbi:MAG: GAF domain-containing protein [Cyclobacteriaceae bacterium]
MRLTDYKIRSESAIKNTSLVYLAAAALLCTAEFVSDFKASTPALALIFMAEAIIITILAYRYTHSEYLRVMIIASVFLMIEAHFINVPRTFHVVIYWLPLVPVVALIIQNIRAAFAWGIIVLITHVFNYYYIKGITGAEYVIEASLLSYLLTGAVFISLMVACTYLLYQLLGMAYFRMLAKNNELEELRNQIESKNKRLTSYQETLFRLSKDKSIYRNGDSHLFEALCQAMTETLGVNRTSVWLLDDNREYLERKFICDVGKVTTEPAQLAYEAYPSYFEAIYHKPYICADDAATHPDTSCFRDSYLEPLQIYSMLDCPIKLDQKVWGVICCESRFTTRKWETEDILFVQSVADLIALSFKNRRIKGLLSQLQSNNTDLATKNQAIASLNEQLQGANSNLEEKVALRTHRLEEKNKQLTEYAFINSHLLRAPLARVLGLSQLIAREVELESDKVLIDTLINSTKDLDAIIRRISHLLDDKEGIKREDIEATIAKKLKKL